LLQERFEATVPLASLSAGSQAPLFEIDAVLAALRRQWLIMVGGLVVGLLLGGAFLLTAVPKYTSTADILVFSETQQQLVSQLLAQSGSADDDAAFLSQVELVQSNGVVDTVITKLDLANDPRFSGNATGLLQEVLAFLHLGGDGAQPLDPQVQHNLIRDRLHAGLDVDRAGKANVLRIAYTANDPAFAARVAQAFADAYLEDQLNSKYDAIRSASTWLEARIEELKQQSMASDAAVQTFKLEHRLVDTDGKLITDQQLEQLTASLVSAQAATSEAKARYDHIAELVRSGDPNAVVSDALDDPAITDLRSKFLDASRRYQDISSRLGADHERARLAAAEMEEYKRLIFAELGRIAESFHSTYLVAQSQQEAIEQRVRDATEAASAASTAQVQLRELQREADTYRNLYQSFLQNYQESVQRQSFPVNEARVISRAEVPSRPSSPRATIVLGMAGAAGILLGFGGAVFREYRDRYFRTTAQIASELNEEVLGIVPQISDHAIQADARKRRARLRKAKRAKAATSEAQLLADAGLMSRFVAEEPMSLFAETMRSCKIAIDQFTPPNRRPVIGVVSSLPGEGKSVIAMNLAVHLARQGKRTTLIDADLRNPAASRVLVPAAQQGLVELLSDPATGLDQVLVRDDATGLEVIPSATRQAVPYSSELLSSDGMDGVLEQLSDRDYVIVDLAPIGLVVDARSIAPKLDAFILVVEWGRTPRRTVRELLGRERLIAEKCIGVVLNKVDTDRLKLYSDEPTAEYYGKSGYFRASAA
jgi:polysaccharide biosynthesis transport protein